MLKNKTEKQPFVSVVIATYNREKYIRKAIESILNQTYKNIEVIIIDDSSTNETQDIISGFNQKDTRIVYIRNKHRIGFVKSLNKGIRIAGGNYIARLDDDDFWCDCQKLEKQIRFLEGHPEYILTGGGIIIINEGGQEIQRYLNPETDKEIRDAMLFECPISHGAVVFRKDAWKKVGGYNEKPCVPEDWDLWCQFGKFGKMYNFPEYFLIFLGGQQNKTKYIVRKNLKNKLELRRKYRNDYPNFFRNILYGEICYFYSFLPSSFRQFLKPITSKIRQIIFNPF